MRWERTNKNVESLQEIVGKLSTVQVTLRAQAAACKEQAEKFRLLAEEAKKREVASGPVDPA